MKKKKSLSKGKVIPDSKPENGYKKDAKAAEFSRKADKKYKPKK